MAIAVAQKIWKFSLFHIIFEILVFFCKIPGMYFILNLIPYAGTVIMFLETAEGEDAKHRPINRKIHFFVAVISLLLDIGFFGIGEGGLLARGVYWLLRKPVFKFAGKGGIRLLRKATVLTSERSVGSSVSRASAKEQTGKEALQAIRFIENRARMNGRQFSAAISNEIAKAIEKNPRYAGELLHLAGETVNHEWNKQVKHIAKRAAEYRQQSYSNNERKETNVNEILLSEDEKKAFKNKTKKTTEVIKEMVKRKIMQDLSQARQRARESGI